MGTWGAAIFADDFAADVREAYLDRLASGESPGAASRAVIAEHGQLDGDEAPIFWFALAATQWEYGALDPKVKKQALQLLDARTDAATWREGGIDKRRAATLGALAAKLRMKPPKLRRPRRRKPVEVPSRSIASPDGSAIATAFIIGNLAQVAIEIPEFGGGGGVFSAVCGLDEIRLTWRGNKTLEISYPPVSTDAREKAFFLRGRTIVLRFVRRRHRNP